MKKEIPELYRTDVLKMSVMDRGRFSSIASFIAVPGFLIAQLLYKKVGHVVAMPIGVLSELLEQVGTVFAQTLPQFYATIPVGVLGPAGIASVNAALAYEAERIGMGQGELHAAKENFRTILNMLAGLASVEVYAMGTRMGRPGFFYANTHASK